MAKERKAFPLRLDLELYQAVEKWAGDEFRSVNAHIEYLLRESLKKNGRLKGLPPQAAEDQPKSAPSGDDEAAEDGSS
ncbi:Arc family DNA-binding protein [Paenibacillus sp. D51F]